MRCKGIYVGLALAAVVLTGGLGVCQFERGTGLPSSYDYRETLRAPEIKNQGDLGTCWAFASLMALESVLLPEEILDLSEDHMSLQNGFQLTQSEGGEYTMSMAYLLGWQGPVLEKEDPYGDSVSPLGLKPVKYVQGIQILPSKDYEKIKAAVYKKGGVQSSLYTSIKDHTSRSVYYNESAASYYYAGKEKPNHDVVIVGWDDTYPKEKFNSKPKGDGAFLCASSWGTGFGDEGYFYVSYYDTNIGKQNIVYTDVESANNYDYIYQTDLSGWVGQLGYGAESAYAANVYQAGKRERLEAVGFYATDVDTEYEVYVMRHVGENPDFAQRVRMAEGKVENSGFYTIRLNQPIDLDEGERFGVIVKITTPEAVHPIAIEYQADDILGQVDVSDGEGYISDDGIQWESAERTYHCNLCLKAYTVERDGVS